MALSDELISQFAKATVKTNKSKKETTVYGTVAEYNGKKYVQLDGSELLTPVLSTTNVEPGERVTVMIKNHTATITGNISSPAARTDEVKEVVDSVKVLDNIMAKKADIEELVAGTATIGDLKTKTAEISEALIDKASVKDLEALDLKVTGKFETADAEIGTLKTDVGIINKALIDKASIEDLEAVRGNINDLETKKLDAESAKILYANIDFANIGEAAFKKIFSNSGLIENLVVGDGSITGVLVGVTIKGDIIEGSTIVADKLVVKGEDGLYYKLNTDGNTTEAEQTEYNSLNGSVIAAKSITATKVDVNDLVAFGATIGGFNITDQSIYSGVKESADNSTRGIYFDTEGQMSIGDSDHFFRYFRTTDENGNEVYKLEISADSLLFGSGSKKSVADIEALTEHVKVGTWVDPDTGNEQPSIELAEGDSDFKQIITNTKTFFTDGDNVSTTIGKDGIKTHNIDVGSEIKQDYFVTSVRENGNRGTRWTGGDNILSSDTKRIVELTYSGDEDYWYLENEFSDLKAVFSFDAKASQSESILKFFFTDFGGHINAANMLTSQGEELSINSDNIAAGWNISFTNIPTTWTRYWVAMEFDECSDDIEFALMLDGSGTIEIRKTKLENGTTPTIWCPSKYYNG